MIADNPYFIPDDHASEWQRVVESVCNVSSVMLLGDTDSGKSVFARYLADFALRHDRPVAFIDTDIGQSVVGPPTTVGLKFLNRSVEELGDEPDALAFVGDISPNGCRTEFVVACRRIADITARTPTNALRLIDTTGMIRGVPGYLLKTSKIDALRPDIIVAIGEPDSRPLTAILRTYITRDDLRMERLPVSSRVKRKSSSVRRTHRDLRFTTYFHDAVSVAFGFEDVPLTGAPLLKSTVRPTDLVGTVAGLLDAQGDAVGIGIVERVDPAAGVVRLSCLPRVAERVVSIRLTNFIPTRRD